MTALDVNNAKAMHSSSSITLVCSHEHTCTVFVLAEELMHSCFSSFRNLSPTAILSISSFCIFPPTFLPIFPAVPARSFAFFAHLFPLQFEYIVGLLYRETQPQAATEDYW